MTADDLRALVILEIKGLSSRFTAPTDYDNAIAKAVQETGWVAPWSTNFRALWINNRAKRHLFEMLRIESASSFKAGNYSLGQRFDHYSKLVKDADTDFKEAIEDNPEEFTDVEAYKMFGSIAGPGFRYDASGRDITDYTNLSELDD